MDQVWLQSIDEKQLQTLFADLLRAMAYKQVTVTHGNLEFGRDVVFCEKDRLGRDIWRGAQLKAGPLSGSLSAENGVRAIVNQIETALDTPFQGINGEKIRLQEVIPLCFMRTSM